MLLAKQLGYRIFGIYGDRLTWPDVVAGALRATACTTAPAGLRMAQFEASKRKFRVNVGGRSAGAMARLLHSRRKGRGAPCRPAFCLPFRPCGVLDRRASNGAPRVLWPGWRTFH